MISPSARNVAREQQLTACASGHFEDRAGVGSQFLGRAAGEVEGQAGVGKAVVGDLKLRGAIGLGVGKPVDEARSAADFDLDDAEPGVEAGQSPKEFLRVALELAEAKELRLPLVPEDGAAKDEAEGHFVSEASKVVMLELAPGNCKCVQVQNLRWR